MRSGLFSVVLGLAVVSAVRCLIIVPPQNDAVYIGSTVTLECVASSASPRVQWTEFITNPTTGAPISDNGLILPGHPNAARYSIDSPDSNTYNLVISPVQLADGGTYRCQDTSDSSSPAYLQLVTIFADTNCTSNIPASGYVREDQYYTITCEIIYRGNAAPQMWWTLPVDQFYLTTTVTTNQTVTSGIALNMTRWSSWVNFKCLTNFTERGFVGLPFSATNVPIWNNTYETPTLDVQWPPKNMYIVPDQASYEIGDRIECHADANPDATYYIMNTDTLDRWPGFVLDITESLVGGPWQMACSAANNITGTMYTNNYFWTLVVNPRTTTPTPTTTTTTTPPLPQDVCGDLTGRWGAQIPQSVDMCLEVNNTNHGRIVGILRNSTDPYFVEIRGRVLPNQFNQVGFTGVWPVNVGVVTWLGTCRKCYGVEKLQINAVIRRTNDNGPNCGDFGPSFLSATYLFSRTGPPCRAPLSGQFEGLKVLH